MCQVYQIYQVYSTFFTFFILNCELTLIFAIFVKLKVLSLILRIYQEEEEVPVPGSIQGETKMVGTLTPRRSNLKL